MSNLCRVHGVHLFVGEVCRACAYPQPDEPEEKFQPGSLYYRGNDPEHKSLLRKRLKNGAYGKRDI